MYTDDQSDRERKVEVVHDHAAVLQPDGLHARVRLRKVDIFQNLLGTLKIECRPEREVESEALSESDEAS